MRRLCVSRSWRCCSVRRRWSILRCGRSRRIIFICSRLNFVLRFVFGMGGLSLLICWLSILVLKMMIWLWRCMSFICFLMVLLWLIWRICWRIFRFIWSWSRVRMLIFGGI